MSTTKDYMNINFEKLEDVIKLLNSGKHPDENLYQWRYHKLLHHAAMGNHHDIAEMLIMRGADLNCLNQHHETPAHFATDSDEKHLVLKLLLQHKADPNRRDLGDNTPLHKAVLGAQIENVKILLQAKADCTIVNCEGETPLQLAQGLGYSRRITALMQEHIKAQSEMQSETVVQEPTQEPIKVEESETVIAKRTSPCRLM